MSKLGPILAGASVCLALAIVLVATAGAKQVPKALLPLLVGTSAILWRNARSAAASIERDIADYRRFRGKTLEGELLVSFAAKKVRSLGLGAALLHIRGRPTGGTDRFITSVAFRVRSLRGNAIVVRSDKRSADATALQLAKQLRRRMLAALRSR